MFRRRSSSKKLQEGGGGSPLGSRSGELDSPLEGEEGGRRSPTQLLASLLTPPVMPEMNLHSRLTDNPGEVALDFLPSLYKLCEWSLLYLLGWLGLSYAWLLLLATLHLSTQAGRSKAAQLAAPTRGGKKKKTGGDKEKEKMSGDKEKELLLSLGPELLPSWVVFPDTDRAEWINVILRKMWPKLGGLADQVARLLVEPKVKEIMKRLSLKGFDLEALSNFKIRKLVLGSEAARVLGIRVFERGTAREEIVMDVEISYAGDARLKFSLQNIDCEINQICLRTTARIVLRPLLEELPFVGGLELYLLQMPILDYSLGGLAAAGDLPGMSALVRAVINSIVSRGFVWPNRFSMHLPMDSVTKMFGHTFPMVAPQGVLCVGVREGRDLVKKDKHLIHGKSDPYVVLSCGEARLSFVEQFVDSDLNPVWNYEAHFPIEEPAGLNLQLEVYDYDKGSDDDILGRSTHSVLELVNSGSFKDWVSLEEAKHGQVHLTAVWRPLLEHQGPEGACVVSVYVESASSLQAERAASQAILAKCDVKVGPGEGFRSLSSKKPSPGEALSVFQTKPRSPGEQHVWREGRAMVSRSPDTDTVSLQVSDQRTGSVLGRMGLRVSTIAQLPQQQALRTQYPLEGSANPDASITLSVKLYYF